MAKDVTERVCLNCGVSKDVSEYWPNGRGLKLRCKTCTNQHYREVRYPKRKTDERYKAAVRAGNKRYRQRHPEAVKAHNRAQRIPMASECQQCGASNTLLHRHHPDYSKPDQVITLCVTCHERVHHHHA